MKRKCIVFIFFMAILCPITVNAGITGKIMGRVIDSKTKEPLPGANIIILGTTLGASTDRQGNYYIINVPPGRYSVKALFMGYRTVQMNNVIVQVDRTTHLNFSLDPSFIQTKAIEVVAKRNAIIRDLTSTDQKVSSRQIKDLPVENMTDILRLQAGITEDAGGGIHLRGGRSAEVQYYVDGIAVTNPFGGGLAVPVQNNVIQELEVISGTFNAEYGQAMSGIVNIVTKDGGRKTDGTISAYSGDFITNHKDVFMNIQDINPLSQRYLEGTLSGPVPFLKKRVTYFVSARYHNEENWLYGKRVHMPSDTCDFTSPNPKNWRIQKTGDNKIIPLNPSKGVSYQAKITFRPIKDLKISYNVMGNYSNWKNYNHFERYNPESIPTNYSTGVNQLLTLTHTISPSTYHEIRISHYWNNYERHCRKNPFDPFYDKGITKKAHVPSDVFAVGGVDASFTYRKSITTAVKYDIVSQINRYNLIKSGFEFRQNALTDNWFVVRKDEGTNWQLHIDDVTSFAHNYYHKVPVEASAYIQDKIEVQDLVVNAGVRFDYFDPKSKVPVNMMDPANKRHLAETVAYRWAKPKNQISPRIGLAFPITDNGNLHVSYGHFFQIPELGRLYENPEFEVVGQFETYIGNADLRAQRTTMYEIGLQQQIITNLVLDATAYYKDIRNLTGTKLYKTFEQDKYGQYSNTDYGNVWGVTLSLDLMKTGLLSANLDYTYQIADGNGSDPKHAFYDARNRDEASKTLIPLNWDQRHVLNGIVTIAGKSWGVSTIGQFHSGFPYTPLTPYNRTQNIQLRNMGRRKPVWNVDLKIYKNVFIGREKTTFFVKIDNVFDHLQNEYRPEITQRELIAHKSKDFLNSLYEFRFNPASQPRPRLIKAGFTIEL